MRQSQFPMYVKQRFGQGNTKLLCYKGRKVSTMKVLLLEDVLVSVAKVGKTSSQFLKVGRDKTFERYFCVRIPFALGAH